MTLQDGWPQERWTAAGTNSAAFGASNQSIGGSSLSAGYGNYAYATSSVTLGEYNYTYGQGAVALGRWNSANGSAALAGGYFATSPSHYGVALGSYTNAYSYSSMAVGRYNAPVGTENVSSELTAARTTWRSGDSLFVVSNGTSSSARSNALVVKKNGEVEIGKIPAKGGIPMYQP